MWLAPRWVCSAPAALVGLEESKGAIAPGFDADIVIVDPQERTPVRAEHIRWRQRHAALEGKEFDFAIKTVYLRGQALTPCATPRGRMVRPAMALR